MTTNPTLPHGRMPAFTLLLALGLALGGALLAPTASAFCNGTDQSVGDATVILVAGGEGCTFEGHTAPYAEVDALGQQVHPLP